MIQRLRTRIATGDAQGGFTLIELLVVIIIIGILLAVAVPSYLGFKGRAETSAAKANVRAALPAVEAHYSDTGSYAGMTTAALQAIDPNIKLSVIRLKADNTKYCIESTHDGTAGGSAPHFIVGPGGTITAGNCPNPVV